MDRYRNAGQESRNEEKTEINSSRTRAGKVKAEAKYTEAIKQVKKSIETNKQKYVEELAMIMEKATREGNVRQLCDTVNYNKLERPVKIKKARQ
ncbi:unnamed protein product [Schistosoma margrebowiei]|uniref:Uncharacterized protein n=1 Tax=Schistosoma margrebowiei TaxID=48269 RepID=A0A183LFW3_9TREM|nr:unnamed protein product [Schistosoma margrebowiei]